MREVIDAHHHLWMVSQGEYAWIPRGGLLDRDFGIADAASAREKSGVTEIVLVQASDTREDTEFMLRVADSNPEILGVVGWISLDRPAEAREALESLQGSNMLKGIRCLSHDYPDPGWLLRPSVAESLDIVVRHGLTFDSVAVTTAQLASIIALADRHSDLSIVIDHLGSPSGQVEPREPWADLIVQAAKRPNTVIKLSGLATRSPDFNDWQPWVDHVLEHFGPDRMMLGSDWPVSTLAADYVTIWRAQLNTIAGLSSSERSQIVEQTARTVYALG